VRVSLDYLSQNDGSTYTLMLSENVIPREPSGTQPHKWTDTIESMLGFTWNNSGGQNINDQIRMDLARPASHHPGGVLATFCDGHTIFLPEDIEYFVLVHLMTPNSRDCGYTSFPPGKEDVFDEAWLE